MTYKDFVNVQYVRDRVAVIAASKDDNEAAHGDEDDLHQAVLIAISQGADNPRELAAEALKTLDIDFDRWYA